MKGYTPLEYTYFSNCSLQFFILHWT